MRSAGRHFRSPNVGCRNHFRFRPALERLEKRALPATYFQVSGFPSPVIAGVAENVTVTARMPDGSIDYNYWSPFHFKSSDPWAALPETSFLTNGTGTFSIKLHSAGTRSITALNSNGTITGSQTGIVVNPAATSQFLLSGFTSPLTTGAMQKLTVTAADAFGNTTKAYTGTLHFDSSDPIAVLPPDSTLSNGVGTFNVTFRTSGTQFLTTTDTVNNVIAGQLSAIPQNVPVYSQLPNPSGGHDKSAWYAPDGLDNDQYIWDSFIVDSNQLINQIQWRGCYTNYLSGAGQSPVYDFTVAIFGSIAQETQPDVTAPAMVRYQTGGNAGELLVGTYGGVLMYDYSFTLPTAFHAVAGTKYWVEIVAWQGLTPFYYWPPDWSLAYGTGGTGSHFRGIGGTGLYYQTISNDTVFTLVTASNAPGIIVEPAPTPPVVAETIINHGDVQRSMVTSVTVNFDQVVSLPANPADAFQLKRNDNATVNVLAAVTETSFTSVNLTFTDGAVNGNSLADGRYTLTILPNLVSNANGQLDGNGNGIGGDPYVLNSSGTAGIFRLFGDADGNATVNSNDFAAFRTMFGLGSSIFDFDGDGQTNSTDFAEFRTRFGLMI